MRNNCLVPFKEREVQQGDNASVQRDRTNYNTLQSSMRTGIERTFGQLVNRWRFLFKYVYVKDPVKCVKVVNAACVLHNICKNMYDEDTFRDHIFRLQGTVVNPQGDIVVELSNNRSTYVFEEMGSDIDEEADQIAGYNKRERLLADAKTYSEEFS